uniref:Secreted protein n=1 Tax=Panagrellus redivivus TaxID=6233 RepID=A0A7E4W3G8_PANRE
MIASVSSLKPQCFLKNNTLSTTPINPASHYKLHYTHYAAFIAWRQSTGTALRMAGSMDEIRARRRHCASTSYVSLAFSIQFKPILCRWVVFLSICFSIATTPTTDDRHPSSRETAIHPISVAKPLPNPRETRNRYFGLSWKV